MKVTQISVFLENQPGRLSEPCKILSDNGINMLTLCLADTEQFGILRFIVKEWDKAKKVLQKAGLVVNTTEVVAVEVDDQPGGLHKILKKIEQGNINVEYMYAFTTFCTSHRAVLVFRFEDPDVAITYLQDQGINLIDSVALYDSMTK